MASLVSNKQGRLIKDTLCILEEWLFCKNRTEAWRTTLNWRWNKDYLLLVGDDLASPNRISNQHMEQLGVIPKKRKQPWKENTLRKMIKKMFVYETKLTSYFTQNENFVFNSNQQIYQHWKQSLFATLLCH